LTYIPGMMGIQGHTELDEFFDRVGHNSSCTEGTVRVCRRVIYGDPCGTLVTTDPMIPHEECELCGRMALLCTDCTWCVDGDWCAEYKPECRYHSIAR
jgi:hypothetical protein